MHPEIRQEGPVLSPVRHGPESEGIPADDQNRVHLPHAPEIVRDEPGNCPICGMALEPRTVTPKPRKTMNSRT